jgi:hypothetical protein
MWITHFTTDNLPAPTAFAYSEGTHHAAGSLRRDPRHGAARLPRPQPATATSSPLQLHTALSSTHDISRYADPDGGSGCRHARRTHGPPPAHARRDVPAHRTPPDETADTSRQSSHARRQTTSARCSEKFAPTPTKGRDQCREDTHPRQSCAGEK